VKILAGLLLAVAILDGCVGRTKQMRRTYAVEEPYHYYFAPPNPYPVLYPYPLGPGNYPPLPGAPDLIGVMRDAPGPVVIGLGLGLGLAAMMAEKERYEAVTGGDRPMEPAETPPARLARLQNDVRHNFNHADAWEALGDEEVRQGRMADAAKSYQAGLPLARDKKHLKYKLEALKSR